MKKADAIIAGWSFGALAANLLPPPFDTIAVGAVFAGLGANIGEVYGVKLSWDALMEIGKAIAKGISGVAMAGWVGSSLLKWVSRCQCLGGAANPTTNGSCDRLFGRQHVQKTITAFTLRKGRDLTPEQIKEMAKAHFQSQLGD